MDEFEKKMILFFNKHRSKSFDAFSGFANNVPFLIIVWIAIGFFIIFSDIFAGISVCLELAVVFALHFAISEGILKWGGKKLALERVRPYIKYPAEIKSIGKKFSDSSFPSSHVSAMVGGLTVLVSAYAFLWPIAVAIVLLLGWSRLRNGMHYPSDILAGIVLGLAYGCSALWIFN